MSDGSAVVDEKHGRSATRQDERALVAVDGTNVSPIERPRMRRPKLGGKPNDVSH